MERHPSPSPQPQEWVRRWLICLTDPLVDLEDRVETEHAITAIVAAQPRWWAAWVSGLMADMLATLDPDDPWRSLRIEGSTVLFSDTEGGEFGNWLSFTDMVHPAEGRYPTEADLRVDPHLASVRKPLDRVGALLIAHAGTGRQAAHRFLLRTIGPTTALDPVRADDLFTSTARALRYVQHRRREMVGYEDPFFRMDGGMWIGRADSIVKGEALDDGRIASAVKANSVEQGRYRLSVGHEDEAQAAGPHDPTDGDIP